MRTALIILLALISSWASAIDLRGVYVPPGGDIYGVTAQSGPVDLQPAMEAATTSWNSLILDDWSLTIKYGWSDSIPGALAQYWGWWLPFGDGRHFQARILFNPTYDWTAFHLPTVALHEVGHSGVGVGPRWTSEIADGRVDVLAPLPMAGSSFPAFADHLTDDSTLMSPFLAPGQIKSITEIDLNAYAQTQGFVNVVPEPITLIVLALGVAVIARRRARRFV